MRIGRGRYGARTRSGCQVRRARAAARRRTGTARERRRPGAAPASRAGPWTCSWCVAVRPAVRSRPAVSEAFPWVLRGSAHCTGPSGLGDTAASFPAGGGPVREVNDTSRTVRRQPRWRSFAAVGGILEAFGKIRGMKWGERGLPVRRGSRRTVPTRSEIGRMSPVVRGWAARFADISSTAGGVSVERPVSGSQRLGRGLSMAGFRLADPARAGRATRLFRKSVGGRGARRRRRVTSCRRGGGRLQRGPGRRPGRCPGRPGPRPGAAFARGACPSDVRCT